MTSHAVAYEVTLDDAYYRAASARTDRVQHAFRWLPALLIGGSIAFFLLFSAIALADGDWLTVLVPGVPFVAYMAYLRWRTPSGLAQFRRSVDYGETIRVDLRDDTVSVVSRSASTDYRWRSFSAVKYSADGILVKLSGPGVLWLPHGAIVTETRDEAVVLFERNVGAS